MADVPAPDSWESADLDESMKRLLISPEKPTDLPSPSSTSTSAAENAAVEDEFKQVDQFLREALEKPRERISILRMEQDILKFIRDPNRQQLEFKDLPTSYLRLAAHRLAQHYFLQSIAMPENILPDGTGSLIVLSKTSYSNKLPTIRLVDIPVSLPQEQTITAVKVAIKPRSQRNSQTSSSSDAKSSSKSSGLKSVEERKEEYNKARARIFSGGSTTREAEMNSQTNFVPFSYVPGRSDEQTFDEDPVFNLPSDLSDSSLVGNLSDGNVAIDQEASRYRTGNRVAILRDREVDRKDPDYNRSYDRYMQRFDPGYGFNTTQYSMQPMFSPTVSYNTEFPQLGSTHRLQLSIDHQPRPMPQHMHGPWSVASPASPIRYGHHESMPPYSPGFIRARPTSVYVHNSSQYHPVPPHFGMQFINQHEHVQSFSQVRQQQSESSFGVARPR